VLFVVCTFTCLNTDARDKLKIFDGPSTSLTATTIVPALETPISDGQNAIWCASFTAAWKTLTDNFAKGDLLLAGSPEAAVLLNESADPRPFVPSGIMYAAAGWKQKGIMEKIQTDLRRIFPGAASPRFPDLADDSFVAYSCLEANVTFPIPYFQNRKPLEFIDAAGRKTSIASFGIRPEDSDTYDQLRHQPRILFRKGGPENKDMEFAADLCAESSPSQIIVACIGAEPTLSAALKRITKEMDEARKLKETSPGATKGIEEIGMRDVLLIPDIFWKISHRFSELERKPFANPALKGQRLDVAQQDIQFRLNRSGAELKSEAKMYCASAPANFVLNRPFLICMKQRDAAMPYFVMWVGNAELLAPWQESEQTESIQ